MTRLAAEGGHLELLQWARAQGCPWRQRTVTCAIASGHVGMLEWMMAHGCSWPRNASLMAAATGHIHSHK